MGEGECMGGSHRMGEGGDSFGLEQQSVEETRLHLMSVWTALCRLLAFRVRSGRGVFRVRCGRGVFRVRFEKRGLIGGDLEEGC